MSCYISPMTGQPSVLAGLLEAKYGTESRDRIMSYIYSDQFEEKYGNFRSPVTDIPLDAEKEPSFEWIEKNVLKIDQTPEVKPGVAELFESNPKLANQVYEALGFVPKIITREGQEYLNNPRIRFFVKIADEVRASLPNVKEGYTRLYRGNRPSDLKSNPQFTNSLEGIALPFLMSYEGQLSYIDIPTNDLSKYVQKGGVATNAEFIVTSDIAKSAIPIDNSIVDKYKKQYPDKLAPVEITPEQEQQAQQLYSQYLMLGSQADLEGFKQFVNQSMYQRTQENQATETLYQLPEGRETEEFVATEKTIREVAASLSARIGMPVQIVTKPQERYKGRITESTVVRRRTSRTSNSWGDNHVAEINLAHATLDTPVHEILAHPVIRALKDRGYYEILNLSNGEISKEEYDNLLKASIQKATTPSDFNLDFKYKYEIVLPNGTAWRYYETKEEAQEVLDQLKLIEEKYKEKRVLYENLLKELEYGKGKEVLDRIKRTYSSEKKEPTEITFLHTDALGDTRKKTWKKVKDKWYQENTEIHPSNVEMLLNSPRKGYKVVSTNSPKSYTLEEQQEEALVELLGLLTAGKLKEKEDKGLINQLRKLLAEISEFVKSIMFEKEIHVDRFPDNFTLNDLANIFAYSNSKIILPGNEVVYTTPDNKQFKTYGEASKHLSALASQATEVDLNSVKVPKEIVDTADEILVDSFEIRHIDKLPSMFVRMEGKWYQEFAYTPEYKGDPGVDYAPITDEQIVSYYNNPKALGVFKAEDSILNFIKSNEEFEASKGIVEEWKKVNGIEYNPDEIYSRGQEFVSVIGAYSNLDVDLLLQNLLSHIEDVQKAGGKFAVSAFTKPVNRQIYHLEGGGGKIKFKIYPQSQDILWASNRDVYSGSVWDSAEKVDKSKKAELLGVSYTKYPSLNNVNEIQPNLASIVENLAHHHNELGISLTSNNFRLEYDDDIPLQTKKVIDSINSILDERYGKLKKLEIKERVTDTVDIYEIQSETGEVLSTFDSFFMAEFAQSVEFHAENTKIVKKTKDVIGTKPTQTETTLKKSIKEIAEKFEGKPFEDFDGADTWGFTVNGVRYIRQIDPSGVETFSKTSDTINYTNWVDITIKEYYDAFILEGKPREQVDTQALVNLRVAKLKEAAKKYPRTLIRAEVRPIQSSPNLFENDDLPFQLVDEEKLPATSPYSKTYEEAGITYKFKKEESGIITGQWSDNGGETWDYLHPSITKVKVEKFIPPPPPGSTPVQSSMFPDLVPAASAALQFMGTPEYTVSNMAEADDLARGIVDGVNTGKELSVGTLIQDSTDGDTYIIVPKGQTVEAMSFAQYLEEQKGFDDSSFEIKNVGTRVETEDGDFGITIGVTTDNVVQVKLDNGGVEEWDRDNLTVEKKEPELPPPPPLTPGKLKEGITEVPLPMPSSEGNADAIYAALNAEQKTGTGLVVAPEKKLGPSAVWPAWKAFKKDNPEGAVLAYRGNPDFEKVPFYVIGNPFNWQDLAAQGMDRVEAGMVTTRYFIAGVLNPSLYPEHQKELLRIQEICRSGELKGKPVFYYEEKGYATHANAIDYLVNKHDWSNTPSRVNREDIGPEQKQTIKNLLVKTYIEPARNNPQSQVQMPWKNPESNRLPDVYGLLESDYASLVSELKDELGDNYPKNIIYYPAFEFEMNNTPRNIMLAMGSRIDNVTARGQLDFDPEEIAKMSVRLEIAISDNSGKVIGFFGQKYGKDTQEVIANAMLAGFLEAYNKSKGDIKAVKAIGTILLTAKEKSEKPGKNQELWRDILNSFAYSTQDAKLSAIDLLFEKLSHIGYRLDYDAKRILRDYFAEMKNDPSFLNRSTTALTFDTEEVSDSWRDEFDSYTEVLMELADNIDVEAGAYQALKDWQDSSFEMDSKNSASAKLKLFMANQRDLESFSVEFVPYDPTNTEAIDITSDMLVLSDTDVDIRIGDLRRINGKKVMHRDSTPARLNTVVNSKYKRLPKKNMLNLPSVVNFDVLFERAQGILASRPGLEKISSTSPILALELLRADGNANLAELADRLEQAYQSGNKRLLLEFIRVMNLQYSPFYIVSGKRKKSGKTRYIKGAVYVAQRNSQTQTIIKGWMSAQPLAPIMKVRPDGERVIDVDRARSHVEVIKLLGRLDKAFGISLAEADKLAASLKERARTLSPTAQNILSDVDFRKLVEEERVNQSNLSGAQRQIQKKIIQALFKEYNIDLNDAVLNDLAGYTIDKGRRKDKIGNQIGKNSTLRKSWIGQFSYTERGDANGIFSLFFNAATGANKGITDDSNVTEGLENMVTENNPLVAEPQSTKVLANAVGKHTDRLYNGVHKNMEGKQIWDYSLHSALSRALQDFQADHNGFRSQLLASVWGGNYYLQNPEATSNLSLGYLEGLKIDKKKGVMTRRMSDRERYVTSLHAYQNQGQRTFYHYTTHSDKPTTPCFKGIPRVKAVTANGMMHPDIIEAFYTIIEGEYKRIGRVEKMIREQGTTGNHALDSKSGRTFFFFPNLNFEALSEEERPLMYNSDGTLLGNVTSEAATEMIHRKMIEYLQLNVTKTTNTWKKHGIDLSMMDPSYVREVNKTDDGKAGKKAESKEEKQALLDKAIIDYTLNTVLWEMSADVLFLGDPGAVKWKGSIEKTLAEYAKRRAKDIAPRQQLAFEDETYQQLTLSDVSMKYEYAAQFPSNISVAAEITNAQEFITVRERLKFLRHKLEDKDYNMLLEKYEKGEDFSPEDLEIIMGNGGADMNATKPVYAGPRFVNGLVFYDYIKSSAVPLLPQFTRGTELDKLRKLMEENKEAPGRDRYARAVFESGSKEGHNSKPVSLFNSKGEFAELTPEKMQEVQNSTRTLSRAHLGIQQEIPADLDKTETNVVTQLDKLIAEGILELDTTFSMPGYGELTGEQIRELKESVRIQAAKMKLDKLYKSLNVDDPGKPIPPKEVMKLLLDSARASEFSANDIGLLEAVVRETEDGDFIHAFPLYYHSAVEKFEKQLLSKVKKISEFKLPGKSYVQVSSVGIVKDTQLTDKVKQGIVTVGDYDMSQPLQHLRTDENGNVFPAQVIMPFNFHYTDASGNKVKAKLKDFMTPDGKLDTARVPQELLQLIAARIPNQGHNSVVPVEIVGFTPEWMGDVIIVPGAITEQMGSDFDVDKLFTYQRPYMWDKGTKSFKEYSDQLPGATAEEYEEMKQEAERILEKIGRKKEDGSFKSRDVRETIEDLMYEKYRTKDFPKHEVSRDKPLMEKLQKDYFNIHWSILNSPAMFTKIMTKLDKPDLGVMAEKYKPQSLSDYEHTYFHPITQNDMYQSGKDAKDLVGMTSLASTLDAVLQGKDLVLGHYEDIYIPGSRFPLKNPKPTSIELDGLSLTGISGEAISMGVNSTMEDLKSWYSKHDNITIDQTGALDNAKDRNLDYLNITMATYPAFDAMNKLHAVDVKVGDQKIKRGLSKSFQCAFAVQDCLKEFTDEMRQAMDSLSDGEYTENLRLTVLAQLKKKYIKDARGYMSDDDHKNIGALTENFKLTEANLNRAFKNKEGKTRDAEYFLVQLAVLNQFEKLAEIGDRLRAIQKGFNQDTNGAGPNLLYALQQAENHATLSATNNKVFLGEESLLDGQTEELYQATIPVAIKLLDSVFPVAAIKNVMSNVAFWKGKEMSSLSLTSQKEILRFMRSYDISTNPAISVDTVAERARLLYDSQVSESLAKRVEKLKLAYPNNPILNRLQGVISNNVKKPDFVKTIVTPDSRLNENLVIQEFAKLLTDDDANLRALGEDLIIYSQLISPQRSATSVASLVPYGYILGSDIASQLRLNLANLREKKTMPKGFYDQLVQHMPSLAVKISDEVLGANDPIFNISSRPEYPEVLRFDRDHKAVQSIGKEDRDIEGLMLFPPYLYYYSEEEGKQILYKAISTENEFETNTQMYQRIDLLGDEGIVEFDNMADGPARSLFAENRAWHEFEDTDHFYNVQNKVRDSIAATSDPENAYSRWNLESGGAANLDMALEQMSADPEVPTYLRTLAATMASTSAPVQSIEAAQALGYSTQPFQVTVGSNRNSFAASKNTMTLRKDKDIKEAAISLLHETTHQRTSSILHALGWLSKERARLTRASMPSEEFEAQWAKYQAMTEDFAKKNPELYKVAKELDRLRLQAFEQLKAELEARGIDVDQRMQQIFQDKLDTEEDQLLYAMSSLPEFVAHVLTDKGTMAFLNTVEATTPQSFVAKLIDKFLDFLTEFLNSLGFQYNEKSILKECLALSYDLIGADNTTDLEFRETSLAKQTIKFDTESKANDVEHYIGSIARQEYTRTDTATGHIFEVEEQRRKPSAFTEGSSLLREGVNKLSRQIQEIDNALTRPIRTPEDRLRRGQLRLVYKEALDDYDKLVDAKQELEMLSVAKKQLQWVKNVTRKPNLHIQEATIAWQILDTWSTLSQTYSPTYTPSEEVQELVREIEGTGVMLTHMLNKQSIFSFNEEGNRVTNFRIALTLADLGKIDDIDMITAQTAALERVNDKLSQVVSTYTQYQQQTAMAEFRQLTQKLKRFKELVGEKDYKKFMQENESGAVFGLVQEIDSSWYFKTASARKDLSKSLKAILLQADRHDETVAAFGALAPDFDLGTREEYLARENRAAFYRFWRDQESHGTMIDIRKLLDPATGNIRTDAEATAELARLESLSSASIVQKSLKKAQQEYEKYLEERDAKFFEIDSNPGLTDAEKDSLKADFELYNSPMTFFDTRHTLGTTGETVSEEALMHTGRYKPWFVPLSSRAENFDSKYKDIMADPKLKEGYEILVELSEKYRSYLPPSVAEGLHDNFLPVIHPQAMAETMSLFQRMKKTGVGRVMFNAISASREETDKSGREKEIPVKFVGKVPKIKDDKGNVIGVDYSKVSTDLPRMFEMFGEMAIHYNALYPADEMINMARRLLLEENKTRVNSREKPISNLLGLLDYYQDAMIYGQSKDFNEMTSGTPIYSLVPWKHKQLQDEMNKLTTELEKLIGEMLAEGVPFDKETHPYVKRKKELEARIQEISSQGRYISGGKVTDVLMTIQQMKSMSYNPFSAFSNLSFGYMASFIHARGFRADKDGFTKGDYTAAQLRKAYSMMKGNIANSWLKAFGYSHSDLSRKITSIIERTNAIEALIDTKYGKSNLTEDKSNLSKFLDPTAAQKSGDWLTKGAVIIARTLNTPVEVTTASGEVKTISLFDALNVDGEWNEKDYGENKEWSSNNVADQVAWNKFLLRTRMVLTLVFGNQDKNMPLQARKVWWTRMMGQFRLSWIPEGVRTRWGKHQGYNEVLEREIEGRYRTMLRMKGFGVGLLAKQMLSVVTGSNPFEGQKVLEFDKTKNRYVERDMKEFEIENMRRNLAGLAYTALLAAAYYALKAAVPDEEELRKLRKRGENPATSLRIAANVAYRSYQDLILYASPDMFEQITGSIVPSWGVIHDMKGAVGAWYKIATDDKYEWDKFWLKQTKAFPYLNLINKWEFYSNRDISAAVR